MAASSKRFPQYPQFPQSDVENRTDFRARRRGHAHLAEEARRALGIGVDFHSLSELPSPFVHAALGVAVCAVAVALRPGFLGAAGSAIAVAILAVIMSAILMGYDWIVYPPSKRPGIGSTALPVAALVGFALVLAGTLDLGARVFAGVAAVGVIAGLPHLGGLRSTGKEGFWARSLRDGAGIAILIPVFIAANSVVLPVQLRTAIVVLGVALVSFDGLLTESLRMRHAAALAAALGLALGIISIPLSVVPASEGIRAAIGMVLWYGLRGIGVATISKNTRFLAVAEYGFVMVAALFLLRWISVHI